VPIYYPRPVTLHCWKRWSCALIDMARSLSASAFLEQRVVVSASSLFYLLPSAHMRAVTGLFLFKLNNGRRCVEAWRGV